LNWYVEGKLGHNRELNHLDVCHFHFIFISHISQMITYNEGNLKKYQTKIIIAYV
jgi:hypothetical protein